MKLTDRKSLLVYLFALMLAAGSVQCMTIQLGSDEIKFIVAGEEWRYFRGLTPPSTPGDAWRKSDFDDAMWQRGPSGFGYGDDDDATVLNDMEDRYVTVYVRKDFTATGVAADAMVELVIDYDDGFAAYLNDDFVTSRHLPEGEPSSTTTASSHEAGTPETISLGTAGSLLHEGRNVLAIEGHNAAIDSTDFSLTPALRTAASTVRSGNAWVVTSPTVLLRGKTSSAQAVSVRVGALGAQFNPADGTWQAQISLTSGLNMIDAVALDAQSKVVDSASIEILYVSPDKLVTGQISEDTTWSGACIIDGTVVVAPGVVLRIEPGTVVLMKQAASLVVRGQLLAEGTEAGPISFTHYANATTWKRIMLADAADSRLAHCTIEFGGSAGAHQDYYEPGPRDYHEALVVLASNIDIDTCTFQKLPNDDASAEGDAVAIISDDANYPGAASAHIHGSRFVGVGQGIHTRYAYVLVEYCYFQGKQGDNDDVDLYGESTPPPMIRYNLFDVPEHDDRINPTLCSAVIIGNVIKGGDDHGIVLRDKGFPVVIDNVISNCSTGGIAIENTCKALLINNTIYNCDIGLRLFDLGRWGPPYRLTPGGGTATAINCIVWGCPDSITLTDSSNTGITDRGSYITVINCDIQGGQGGVSVSGSQSRLTWGTGNINIDPQFTNASGRDFHLKSQAGRWDPSLLRWVQDQTTSPCIDAGISYTLSDPNLPYSGTIDWRGELWPHGGRINMGGYGGTHEASMSRDSSKGNAADLDYNGAVELPDFALLAAAWMMDEALLVEDIDRNGTVNLNDLLLMGLQWLWQEAK